MAGMKRFVTYIYLYEDKKKGNNVGFAKVEIRGEECRIEIHLRGVYTGKGTCKAYLFRVEAGDMAGFLVGEMNVINGNGDFGTVIKAGGIGDSPYGIYEMEGLCLVSEDERMFVSRWKEGLALEVSRERFKTWEPQAVTTPQPEQEEIENISATEIPMRNIFPKYDWFTIWSQMQKEHTVFTPFEDKEIRCVRIELKDLRELPKRYWYLGNNSFLLHGFFNYHYIIIGNMEKDRWFIGIPGIYQQQERVMAAIFGFPEFMQAEVAGETAGRGEPVNQFGYWYRSMEE